MIKELKRRFLQSKWYFARCQEKDIEARLADKTEEKKLQDKEYSEFVKPHKNYKLNESAVISAMIAKEMKALLESEEIITLV